MVHAENAHTLPRNRRSNVTEPTPPGFQKPTSITRWLSKHMLWFVLIAIGVLFFVSFHLTTKATDMAHALGCEFGETCTSAEGLEATMYLALSMLIRLAIFVGVVVWLSIKVFRAAKRRNSGAK